MKPERSQSPISKSTWMSQQLAVDNALGWPALLAGAAAPEHLVSGSVQIPWASLHDSIRARGDDALSDVPGILERLDVPHLRDLWPAGEVNAPR